MVWELWASTIWSSTVQRPGDPLSIGTVVPFPYGRGLLDSPEVQRRLRRENKAEKPVPSAPGTSSGLGPVLPRKGARPAAQLLFVPIQRCAPAVPAVFPPAA